MRLFVAIESPGEWRNAALEARRHIEDRVSPETARALRWVAPDLLHLTLRFIGEYPEADLVTLRDSLDTAIGAVDLNLGTGVLGTFGGRKARTLWLGLTGDIATLDGLAVRVEQAVVESGVTPEARAFAPHLTLARVRERASVDARVEIARVAADVDGDPAPALAIHHVALVRSVLGGGAPRYDVLARFPTSRQP
jgi:2'-5' RNA ligase